MKAYNCKTNGAPRATDTGGIQGVGVGAGRGVDATHQAPGSDAQGTEENHSALGDGCTDGGLVPPFSAFLQPGKTARMMLTLKRKKFLPMFRRIGIYRTFFRCPSLG